MRFIFMSLARLIFLHMVQPNDTLRDRLYCKLYRVYPFLACFFGYHQGERKFKVNRRTLEMLSLETILSEIFRLGK